MTSILTFETKHGVVAVEVDESVARAAGGEPVAMVNERYVAKGAGPLTAGRGDIVAAAPKSFGEAMSTLKAYAANLDDLIAELEFTPKEVQVQIGLKLSGTAGFVIAKAGVETDMKVAITWEPGKV